MDLSLLNQRSRLSNSSLQSSRTNVNLPDSAYRKIAEMCNDCKKTKGRRTKKSAPTKSSGKGRKMRSKKQKGVTKAHAAPVSKNKKLNMKEAKKKLRQHKK